MQVPLSEYKVLNTYEACADLVKKLDGLKKKNYSVTKCRQRYAKHNEKYLKYTNFDLERCGGNCGEVYEAYKRQCLEARSYLTKQCATYIQKLGTAGVHGVTMVQYLQKWAGHQATEGPVVLRQRQEKSMRKAGEWGGGFYVDVFVVDAEELSREEGTVDENSVYDVRMEKLASEKRMGMINLLDVAAMKKLHYFYVPDALFQSAPPTFEHWMESATIKFGEYVGLYAELSRAVAQFGERNVDAKLWDMNRELGVVCEEAVRVFAEMERVFQKMDAEKRISEYRKDETALPKIILETKLDLMKALDEAMLQGESELSEEDWAKVQQLYEDFLPDRFELKEKGHDVSVKGYVKITHQEGRKRKHRYVSEVEAQAQCERETEAAADLLCDAFKIAYAASNQGKKRDSGGSNVVAVAMAMSHHVNAETQAEPQTVKKTVKKTAQKTAETAKPQSVPPAASIFVDFAAVARGATTAAAAAEAAGDQLRIAAAEARATAGAAAGSAREDRMSIAFLMCMS